MSTNSQTSGRQRSWLEALVNAAKGALIGAANTIPGVSGGTLAVVTGIYDRLVQAVGYFFRGPGGWRANLRFLIPVGVGVILGVLAFARVIDYFLQNFPDQTAFFFIGLILGSLPFIVKTGFGGRLKAAYALPFLVTFGALVGMALAGRPPQTEPITTVTVATAVFLFVGGLVSSATMVIPGISGSFILLVIGLYSTVITAARDLDVVILGIFAVGVGIGIVVIAKLISFLLERWHGITYAAIVGLVLGSVVTLWPGTPPGAAAAVVDFAVFAAGFAGAYFLGSGAGALETEEG
jgi:putative membrane protein